VQHTLDNTKMKIRRTAPSIPSLPPLSLHNGRPSTLHWKYASPSQTNQKTELLEMIQVIRDSLTKGWSLSRALGLKHGMGIGIGMGHQKKLDQLKELEERIRGMHNERLEAIMVNSAMQSSRGGIGMCGAGLGRGRMGSYQAVAKNHISSAMKFLDATTSSLRSDMGTMGSLSARDHNILESTRSGDHFDMQVFIEFDNYDGEGSACSCICVGLDDSGSVSMSLLSDGESYSDNFGRNKKSESEKCECEYSNDDLLSEGSASKTGSGSADTGRTASQTNSSTDSTPVPSSPSTSTSSIGMEDLELNVTTSHFRSNHNPNLDVDVDVTPISGDDDDDDPTIRSTDGMEELGISITTWSSIDLSASQKEKNNNTNSDRNSSAVVDSPGISRRKQFAQRCEKSLQDHESDRKKDNDNINLTNTATAEMNNDDDNDNDNDNHNDDNNVKEVKIQERERIEEVAVSIGDITVRATRTKRVRFSGVKPTMDENLNRARDILASYNNLSNYWEQGK